MPWEVRYSNSRSLPYFFNPGTGKSEWDPPKGLTEAQIRQLPGAAQYLKPIAPDADPNHIPNPGSDTGGIAEQLGDVKLAPIAKPKRARASHILAKSTKSRRPSSWRQAQVTTSPEEARAIIQGHIDHLKSVPPEQVHAAFTAIASTESDCSSAKAGGDLGWFHKGQMQASFEDTTFDLPIGQLSGIVETDSGVHVILRTG